LIHIRIVAWVVLGGPASRPPWLQEEEAGWDARPPVKKFAGTRPAKRLTIVAMGR
jgi:hypothetical protein